MAPQATPVAPPLTDQPSALSTPTSTDANHKSFVPVTLLVFLGICLAHALSYVLYRIVMARRRRSPQDIPDCPDRGVSQFMNGARLTLNFSQNPKSTPDGSPDISDEEKPLTDPSRPADPDIPVDSPAESASTLFTTRTPSLMTMHPNQQLDEALFQEQGQTGAQVPVPAPTQQRLSQRLMAKVKFLSTDRAEAIALDPKLAPVQGPLRPLSMVPSPSRKKRMTLFGLGLKHARGHGGDQETDSDAP